MYKSFHGTIFSLLFVTGILLAAQVLAVDGDYATPYSDNIGTGVCPQGDQSCVNARAGAAGNRDAGLPIMTIFGGMLLLTGLMAAVVWKVKEKKKLTKVQSDK